MARPFMLVSFAFYETYTLCVIPFKASLAGSVVRLEDSGGQDFCDNYGKTSDSYSLP